MAIFDISFFSKSLIRNVSFKMLIPNDRQFGENPEVTKTLFVLHGYTGAADNGGSLITEAYKYNFAIVMPNGENSFYLDGKSTGHKYCTFIGDELVKYVRRTFNLATSRNNTYIIGLSMGGFGAIHTAFKYPDVFGKVGAMSSALIIHDIANMKEGDYNPVANYEYYRECFGDLDILLESENNPEVLAKMLKENGQTIPGLYMCCGTEDFLLENNRIFHSYLKQLEIAHEYHESEGSHDDIFWNEYSSKIANWMFE